MSIVVVTPYQAMLNGEEYVTPMGRSRSDRGDYRPGFAANEACSIQRNHRPFPTPCIEACCSRILAPSCRRRQNLNVQQHTIPPSARPSFSSASYGDIDASFQTVSAGSERSPSPRILLDDNHDRIFIEADLEAARIVGENIRRQDHVQERQVLLEHINGQRATQASDLKELFRAVDLFLFNGRLNRKVEWRWSENEPIFDNQYLGATATRWDKDGNIETQIILSAPLLKSSDFDSRLLLSSWIHELIHAYLFVFCGKRAVEQGGHTEGFRKIGEFIDEWSQGHLHLKETKADLNNFPRLSPMRPQRSQRSYAELGYSVGSDAREKHRVQKRSSQKVQRPVRHHHSHFIAGELFMPHGSTFIGSQSPLPSSPPHYRQPIMVIS